MERISKRTRFAEALWEKIQKALKLLALPETFLDEPHSFSETTKSGKKEEI